MLRGQVVIHDRFHLGYFIQISWVASPVCFSWIRRFPSSLTSYPHPVIGWTWQIGFEYIFFSSRLTPFPRFPSTKFFSSWPYHHEFSSFDFTKNFFIFYSFLGKYGPSPPLWDHRDIIDPDSIIFLIFGGRTGCSEGIFLVRRKSDGSPVTGIFPCPITRLHSMGLDSRVYNFLFVLHT